MKFIPIQQHFPNRALADIEGAVRRTLADSRIGAGMRPGSRIAVGAGSRGVANLSTILRATVAHFQEQGLAPFIFPAMGSHGSGTAEGQRDVLAHYQVTEDSVGCPIVSSLDVVELGTTPEGIETYADRSAFESDGIFLVNRVKWHTTFDAPLESGVMKMAAIGIGKLRGATNYHRHAVRLGFETVIRSAARQLIATGKLLGGLGVMEDAHHATAKVVAMRSAELETQEEKLLAEVRSWMARILFPEVDVLIVNEIGKHISGVGMDAKVVNRHPYGGANVWSWAPTIRRIYVRSLSPLSYGNAVGIGLADLISERLYQSIDWKATRVNAMAASNLTAIKTPVRAETDREALEILSAVAGRKDPKEVTMVWIRNTLELSHIRVSENLLTHAPKDVEREGDAMPFPYEIDSW